jgi:small subunit ribosomal protein S1
VVKQAQFGVFVQIEEGIEGLVHSSEIPPSERRRLQEGQRLPFRILSIDLDRRRVRLTPALGELEETPLGERDEGEPTSTAPGDDQ